MKRVWKTFAVLGVAFVVVCAALSVGRIGTADSASFPNESPTDLSKQATRVLRTSKHMLGLQTELPPQGTEHMQPENKLPSWSMRLPDIGLASGVAKIFLYGAIVVFVVVVVTTFHANMWSNSRARQIARKEEAESAPEAVGARMEKAQVEADDFARSGNFAEAMHTLLLQSIGELRGRLAIPISVSLTSREILHKAPLPPEGRSAFADIIGRVEISYFGTHEPSADEYEACRRSFDALTKNLTQRAAT